MRSFRPLVPLLALLLASPFAALGQNAGPSGRAVTSDALSWVPQGFETLGRRAAFHTDFTFDRSMLQLAGYLIGDADRDTRNAIAKLNGISVHSYHFAAPGLYDPGALEAIRRQCEATGWRHLVAVQGKGDPFHSGQTDLWINFAHMDVTGMMVLFSGPRDLNLIALNGDISTLDLLHLRGHFGIPRFSGDGFAAGPRANRSGAQSRVPYASPAPAGTGPEQAPERSPDENSAGVGLGMPTVEAAPPPPIPPGL
jgi:hypothetical protein